MKLLSCCRRPKSESTRTSSSRRHSNSVVSTPGFGIAIAKFPPGTTYHSPVSSNLRIIASMIWVTWVHPYYIPYLHEHPTAVKDKSSCRIRNLNAI